MFPITYRISKCVSVQSLFYIPTDGGTDGRVIGAQLPKSECCELIAGFMQMLE